MIFKKSLAVLAVLAFTQFSGGAVAHAGDEAINATIAESTVDGVVNEEGRTVFSTQGSELIVTPSTEAAPTGEEIALLAPSIRCGLNVQHVHGSHHVQGTINGPVSEKQFVVTCHTPLEP